MLVYIEIALGVVAILILSRIVTGVAGERAYRRATVFVGVLLACVALVLLTIGARSPYTHANLNVVYDTRYDRTEQIVVGQPTEFGGITLTAPTGADPVTRGASLYITRGCVSCHALEGLGGPVGKPIAGVDPTLVTQRVRRGGLGMPQFSPAGLNDEQLADIIAFLQSLPVAK